MAFDEVLSWAMLAALFVALAVSLAAIARPKKRDRAVTEFARRSGLELDNEAVIASVRRRIVSLSVARYLGALIGLTLTAVLILIVPAWRTSQMVLLIGAPLLLLGLTLGAVIVTLRDSLFTQKSDAPRLARSTVPVAADYVDTRRRLAPTIMLGVAVLLGLVGVGLAASGMPAGRAYLGSAAVPLLLVALCAWAMGQLLSRRVLARPQPASTTLELRWDDALRADTLLNLAQFVSIVCWVSVVASVYGIVQGVDLTGSVNSIVTQMFTWGMLISSLDYALRGARMHVQWRLWPEADVQQPRQALA